MRDEARFVIPKGAVSHSWLPRTFPRFDRNGKGGGILLYIQDDIPSKLIESKMTIEGLFVEINLRKKKWLLCCSYNPEKSLISNHLQEIGNNFDLLSSKFDNYLLMGDFANYLLMNQLFPIFVKFIILKTL